MGRLTLKQVVDKELAGVQRRIDTRMKVGQKEAVFFDLLEHKQSLLRIKDELRGF